MFLIHEVTAEIIIIYEAFFVVFFLFFNEIIIIDFLITNTRGGFVFRKI